MKLAACLTIKDDGDIVGATMQHLYNEGVANIYVADGMSTDGTRDVLAAFPCKVYDDDSPIHRQPYWTTRLAREAFDDGCEWVLAVDADEFWCSPVGTLHDTLAGLDPGFGTALAQMWQYIDYNYREPHPKPLPKVAFRATPGAQVANGNHAVTGVPGSVVGGLRICEIQFRDFEHFCRKIEARCATLDPSLPAGEGAHQTQYRGWTKEQLEPVWEQMVARATVFDPIPVRR